VTGWVRGCVVVVAAMVVVMVAVCVVVVAAAVEEEEVVVGEGGGGSAKSLLHVSWRRKSEMTMARKLARSGLQRGRVKEEGDRKNVQKYAA
jgi:hypothetical protein